MGLRLLENLENGGVEEVNVDGREEDDEGYDNYETAEDDEYEGEGSAVEDSVNSGEHQNDENVQYGVDIGEFAAGYEGRNHHSTDTPAKRAQFRKRVLIAIITVSTAVAAIAACLVASTLVTPSKDGTRKDLTAVGHTSRIAIGIAIGCSLAGFIFAQFGMMFWEHRRVKWILYYSGACCVTGFLSLLLVDVLWVTADNEATTVEKVFGAFVGLVFLGGIPTCAFVCFGTEDLDS